MARETTQLVIYDEMVTAIDRCHRTDEVKQIRDKALALEHYARQALNIQAERRAIEVRVRAERRAGQLLAEVERAKGQRTDITSGHAGPKLTLYAQAKEQAKISDTQAKRWQRLATIPPDKFERKLESTTNKVSTTGLIENEKPIEPVPTRALWFWGRLRDFERMELFAVDPDVIIDEMLDSMKRDAVRLIPQLLGWLKKSKHGRSK